MTLSSRINEKLLDAGALLPSGARLPDEVQVEQVVARVYRHSALGPRAVIRLPDQVFTEAMDLEMEVLGFEPGEDRASVGLRRRRALGFPGWAIVNDPDHARYALEVLKEFKKEARRARSKPGHAKTGIDAIGKRLGRSVPGFLPSFYEEAGRVFIEAGTPSYGAQYFEKAREAERVHALDVDESQRRRAFVEFALAGAVSIKSLSSYAKELASTYEPSEAYEHFRELCVQRTLGGMPPWSGMPKELQRLGKAAGKDMAAESEALLEAVADAPSLSRAAFQFWKAYRKPLLALAKRSARVRGAMLNLFPSSSSQSESFDAYWLELLDECGALDAVIADPSTVPDEARSAGNAATWISRLVTQASGWGRGMPAKGFELLRRMAPRLKAEALPIDVGGGWEGVDVDFCDLALELGVPVKDPKKDMYLSLSAWAERADEPERGRDPVSLVADGRFTHALEQALDEVAGDESFERVARGKKGLEELRRAWITRLVQTLATGGLPDLESGIERVEESTSAQTYQEFPEAYEVLRACTVSDALARTLRGGILDELGWPALEEAVEELEDPQGKRELFFGGTWPHIMVTDGRRVIVVAPDARVLEHDLQLPKKTELADLRYVDGELLVAYRKDYELKGYWSGSPKRRFTIEGDAWRDLCIGGPAVSVPGGGVCEGSTPLKVGDTTLPARYELISDGLSCWRREYRGGRHQMIEVDPETGETGRASLPAFYEEYVEEGKEVDLDASQLLPLPRGMTMSPLGSCDGLVGLRLRLPERDDPWEPIGNRPIEAEGIDGRRFEGRLHGVSPRALLGLPGADRPLPISGDPWNDWDNTYDFDIWDSSGAYRVSKASTGEPGYSTATACVLPLHYWHCLRPRDELGSRSLRKLSEDVVHQLLEAALGERSTRDDNKARATKGELPQTRELLERLVPKITDVRLLAGVVGVVGAAAKAAERLEGVLRSHDPEGEHSGRSVAGLDDDTLKAALDGVADSDWTEGSLVAQLDALREIAEGKDAPLPKSSIHFWDLLGKIGGLAFKAVARGTNDKKRATLLSFLEHWAKSPFAERPEACRVLRVRLHKNDIPFPVQKDDWIGFGAGVVDGNLYYVHCDDIEDPENGWTVLEYAPDGGFKPLPQGKIIEERRVEEPFAGSERLTRFVELARERGALAWDPAGVEILVERAGLTAAEAALLWAGLPNLNSWDRNFLPKELREELGLKVTAAERGRDALREVEGDLLWIVVGAAIPERPEELWSAGDGVDVEGLPASRMADAWIRRIGRRLAVPEELLTSLEREMGYDLKPRDALALFDNPTGDPRLNRDGTWFLGEEGEVDCRGKKVEEVFGGQVLSAVALYVPYLFVELPVGDALRDGIAEVIDRARSRLASPELLLGPITVGDYDEKKATAFVSKLGDRPYRPPGKKRPSKRPSCDTGEVVALVTEWESASLAFRPARVESWKRLRKLAADGWYDTTVSPVNAAETLLSRGFEAMAERVRSTPVAKGRYEANPLLSVPELVMEVGAAYDIDEDAAVLYLQTLALISPTSRKVQMWNGWKAARYRKAGKDLAERELLVEAKRSRAGRPFFLPGGWEALGAPLPPIETWKLPLYDVTRAKDGRLVFPLNRLLPLRPLHEIFKSAWKRVRGGDRPAYEEVR